MKLRVKRFCAVVIFSAVAATALYAEFQKGNYSPAQLGLLQQSQPVSLATDATYQVPAYPVPAPELAAGEGVQEVRIYCSTCHSPRYITMQPPLPGATWEAEVNKMNKAFGAGIPEESTQKIIAYLNAHYTPETRK